MLYLPNAGEIMRCHGAFCSDDEVGRVVAHLRDQGEPNYIEDITKESEEGEGVSEQDRDALYFDAVQIVQDAGKASTSMIQRHLKIGYNRAARIIDQMEMSGVVGPADGARPREVL
jgi:S-DNA-T family DNA segregation ATPase FtsK/SpoIIIE